MYRIRLFFVKFFKERKMRFMFFCLAFIVFSSSFSYASSEKSTEEKTLSVSRKQLQEVVSENGFFNESPAVFHPECNNPRLLEKVLKRIEQYYQEKKQTSIIEQRKQALLLKKLEKFQSVDINNFIPKENYAVADRLIDIKINDGIKAKDMSLCKSMGEREIYLLIYPQNGFYTIEIINFPGQPISKNFTTVYD